MKKPGRNDPCPCGSGKKFKNCCLEKSPPVVVESAEFIRRKLRKTESDLTIRLMSYSVERFGEDILEYAWDEFALWNQVDLAEYDLPDLDSIFGLWYVFTWDIWNILEDMESDHDALKMNFLTVAMLYQMEHPDDVDAFEKRYIEEMTRQPYSFFQVLDRDPGNTLTLRDLFLQETHVVMEKQASLEDIKGRIIFTRVITLDGVSLMVGAIPYVIGPQYQGELIDFRRDLEKENKGPLTRDILMELDFDFREFFLEILQKASPNRIPQLQNTDGDPLVPVKLFYHLGCSPQTAFDRLKDLAVGISSEELLIGAVYDKKGTLVSIQFPWMMKGNKQNPGWENTVLGHIEINKNRMTIQVNSKERADRIQKEIRRRLQTQAVYKKSVITSVQKMFEKHNMGFPGIPGKAGDTSHEELMNLPEVQAKISQMAQKHWDAWPDTPVPALGGLTPRQAAQDPIGREKLEGLFLHYEAMSQQHGKNEFAPDIAYLKNLLGIK